MLTQNNIFKPYVPYQRNNIEQYRYYSTSVLLKICRLMLVLRKMLLKALR